MISRLLTKSPKKVIRLKQKNSHHNKDIIHDSLVIEYDNMDDTFFNNDQKSRIKKLDRRCKKTKIILY